MKKKWLKCIVLIAVTGLLVYNSVYFKKLDAPKNQIEDIKKDPVAFAKAFWNDKLSKAIDSAVSMEVFEKEFIEKGAQITINKYSHSQGVSDVAYMLQKFSGKIKEVTEDKFVLTLTNSRASHLSFNVGNYFGNGVRDVTGLIAMGDFENSMDYNMISSALNKIVKMDVILPLKNKIKVNDSLTVVGCVEIVTGRLSDEILPVKITINN
jgi:predicted lipoprotein